MLTMRKEYPDIPFGHRQHNHGGHCRWIHGHNWTIAVTLGCERVDENNFILDFGKMKFIKKWIDEELDHACLFNQSDPIVTDGTLKQLTKLGVIKPLVLHDVSCEGLAVFFSGVFSSLLATNLSPEDVERRVKVVAVEVFEDRKNSTTYMPIG